MLAPGQGQQLRLGDNAAQRVALPAGGDALVLHSLNKPTLSLGAPAAL